MIIFDLDGCLADCEHRRHFVDPSKNSDYEPIFPDIMECNAYTKPIWVHKDIILITEPPQRKQFGPDWRSFYQACGEDKPIQETILIIRSLHGCDYYDKQYDVHICSGRCESVRDKTENWLRRHCISYNSLKMRPIGDYTPDDQLKEKWLDEVLAQGKTIDFVFDSNPKSIDMWRRRGIFVFNCAQRDEEF